MKALVPRRWARALAGLTDSGLQIAAVVLLCGSASALIECVAHTVLLSERVSPEMRTFVDAATIGILVSALTCVSLLYNRARRKVLLEHLRVVAELNHDVRNALQTIIYSHYLPQPEQAEAVLASVKRIDRTLKHLFPAIGERRPGA